MLNLLPDSPAVVRPVTKAPPVSVSFEFFPPKTAEMETRLWRTVELLAPLKPRFVSVTYGAGGSTRERTHATLKRILAETELQPAAHLTCVGATCDEVDTVARDYLAAGVSHVVALRGDPPSGFGGTYTPTPGGYAYAADLVAGLRRIGDFEISVAAYPEIHQHAASAAADLDNLKRKIDQGATRAITQCFFDAAVYLRFLERVRAAGITVPIVPGIMPVSNFEGVQKFAAACGASVPGDMAHLFEGLGHSPDRRHLVALSWTVGLCRQLRLAGVNEFHFYTLNRAALTQGICRMLGIEAQAPSSTRQSI